MAAKFIDILLSFLVAIANIAFTPINTILVNLVPSLTDTINTFTQAVGFFLTSKLSWFFYMVPSRTKSVLIVYLTFLIGYYTISMSVHGIIWLIKVIKKLPMA